MRDSGRDSHSIIRVTVWGLCLNALLAGLKLAGGLVFGSIALVADAVHSLSDMSTDIVVILGVRLSSRPADEGHAYGHGRFETIATSIIGVVLVGVAIMICWEAGVSIYRHEHSIPGFAVLAVATISIGSKEWLYQITRRIARRVGSSALRVNAWHHRSDALSSVAVLFGAIAGLLGWDHGDQLAAVVVGVMIGMVGLKALWDIVFELVEGSVSLEEQKSIAQAIQGVPGVVGWHRMRTRRMGREVFMDVHVLVDARLSVIEGHRISSAVEHAVAHSTGRPIDVVVHYEPVLHTGSTKEAYSCGE